MHRVKLISNKGAGAHTANSVVTFETKCRIIASVMWLVGCSRQKDEL